LEKTFFGKGEKGMIVKEETGGTVLGLIRRLESRRPDTFNEWMNICDFLYEQAKEYTRLTGQVYVPSLPTPPEAPLSRFTGF